MTEGVVPSSDLAAAVDLVVCCEVIRDEVEGLLEPMAARPEVDWVPQGLHNDPKGLSSHLAERVQWAEQELGAKRIGLGFGLCSRGVEGVRPERATVGLPRAHDCITLLLGDRRRYEQWVTAKPGTYWYSPGWNRCHTPPGEARFTELKARYSERYDAETVEELVAMERESLACYSVAAWVDQGFGVAAEEVERTKRCALEMGWQFEKVAGDSRLLADLLAGRWDAERFLLVGPGEGVRMTADDRVVEAVTIEGRAAFPKNENRG